MKKWWIFVLSLCFILPCFAFVGCGLFAENAICKIGGTAYSTLAEAILACQEGGTIAVYNDVKDEIPEDKRQELGLVSAYKNGNTYTQYIINKNIKIIGVNQNYRQPKIYGSFKLSSTATLDNLEIINDYISLENNELNKPFETAIQVLDGQVSIKNCKIHTSSSVNNEIVNENKLSCLSGIEVLRKTNDGSTYSYHLKNNNLYGYNYVTDNSQSFAISFVSEREGFACVEPFTVNYQDQESYKYQSLTNENTIQEKNTTHLCVYNEKTNVYRYLKTFDAKLIKQDCFAEGSEVEFLGDLFGPEEKEDFIVYGKMKFKAIKNLNLIIVTPTGKVERNVVQDQNVTVIKYGPM